MALLSLAIQTNGIIEWVFHVLDSISRQSVDENLFEVIVTDNGDNDLFYNKMLEYKKKHRNLIYQRNESKLFMNFHIILRGPEELESGKMILKFLKNLGI